MPTEVVMPQMGESITEGTLTKWLKKPGDTVARDEPIFEISTDKVDAEIPSPVAGTLGELKVQEGATVGVGTVVCAIEEGGSAAAPAAAPKEETVTPAAIATAAKDEAVNAPAAAGTGTEVPMPQMGESITEGTITKWLKKIGVQEGQTVTVGSIVAVIGGGAAAAKPAPVASAPAPAPGPAATPAPAATSGEAPRSSPLVRKIASENNVDLTAVPGTGASGRITKQDILGHLEGGAPATAPAPVAAAPAPAAAKPAAPAPMSAPAPGELVPLSKMRSIIAKRMVESKATSPHVHTVFKVDMTRIVKLREKEKNKYEQRNGVKLTYMPFITRAAVQALRKHPIVNASMQGEAILYNKNINIGIAVALDWGLIVPVIKQCEERNFLGITRAIVDVADRARNKKLAPDEVAGGTFTLTNSGIFGEQFGTPIIAQPQSAILGIGGLNKEAVVLTDKEGNDTIAIRSIQRFTLGFDHRTIDGADAGKFMSDFKAYLENWSEDIG
jgi:2-oxoglutarate dehydrogenase E2 component (dihydrolipoamide succinyltransferase)